MSKAENRSDNLLFGLGGITRGEKGERNSSSPTSISTSVFLDLIHLLPEDPFQADVEPQGVTATSMALRKERSVTPVRPFGTFQATPKSALGPLPPRWLPEI